MKYFAKYLPVEGEIKKGDITDYGLIVKPIFRSGKSWRVKQDDNYIDLKYDVLPKKVKLFLCSRDIPKKGDYVVNNLDLLHGIAQHDLNEGEIKDNEYTKVIGEISREAIWIKEGDEFDEEDWRFVTYADDINPILLDKTKQWDRKKYPVNLEIKGPCGHFH